ncbi:phosphotransferase family protein [Metarhizium rileyi]|uniref:Phosphotransferase family protein n=1 Tax=Metarhizium rileyi (strain RCEF 4871) TaxID=1649241 RepID=A0A167F4L7_METRR|nr:phosphotransferase family protein [Metarhizium rileyi RCEF 4871]
MQSLANLHINHLASQRNDAVDSETDCQRKYVARHLFQKLASQRRLLSDENDGGPFTIWCDDLRPSNSLLDANLQIVGVIDWEFSYAAPNEFTFAPPWWLLLEQPEYWTEGLDNWIERYESCLLIFLEAMEDCEDAALASGKIQDDQRLSYKMRESWRTSDFWTVYAARKNFAFDCAL